MYTLNLKNTDALEQGVTVIFDNEDQATMLFVYVSNANYRQTTEATLYDNIGRIIDSKLIKPNQKQL